MNLSADNCKEKFVQAMYDRLLAESTELAENFEENKNAKANLGALATAVHEILTELAETTSDESTDTIFWDWIAQVNAWLSNLASWQSGFVDVFKNWTPTDPADQALKEALIAVEGPGSPPAQAPTSLKGEIE